MRLGIMFLLLIPVLSLSAEIITPVEMWRAGGEDDDVFFGVIMAAHLAPNGDLWLLDMQLSTLYQYSIDGELMESLMVEGDGPGEVREPTKMFFTPEGKIALVKNFPGKVVMIETDGTPVSSFSFGDATEGGFSGIGDVTPCGNLVLANGNLSSFDGSSSTRNEYLSLFDYQGVEQTNFCSKISENDLGGKMSFNEAESFFEGQTNACSKDGTVYYAPKRNEYLVEGFNSAGEKVSEIKREYKQRKRTAEEIEKHKDGYSATANGVKLEVDVVVEPYVQAIRQIIVRDDNSLWIANSHSFNDLPDGIYGIFDHFSEDGTFIDTVEIHLDADREKDHIFFPSDNLCVVIKDASAAVSSMYSRFEDDEEDYGDAEPLEVIVYKLD